MRINLYNNKYIVGFMLLVYFIPSYFTRISSIMTVYRVLGFACMLLLFLFSIKGKNLSPPLIWTYGFFGTIFLITLINKGDISTFIYDNYAPFALCILFALILEKNPKTLICATKVLDIFVYINLLIMLIFPNGIYTVTGDAHWFLGHKNILSRIMLSILCLALIRTYYLFGKIRLNTIILIVCAVVTLIIAGSATSLIGFVFFGVFLFLFHNKNKRLPRFFTIFTALIVTVTASAALIFFNIQNYFSFFIEAILGRDLTLTNRTEIWQIALNKISSKPIWGYGYLKGSEYVKMLGRSTYTHPHNYFLYILMTGGIVLAAILFVGFFIANRALKRSIDTVYSKIIMFTLITFLIIGLTESLVSTALLYPILILAMNADKIKRSNLQLTMNN